MIIIAEEEVRLVNRHFRQLAISIYQLVGYKNFSHEEVDAHKKDFSQDIKNHVEI